MNYFEEIIKETNEERREFQNKAKMFFKRSNFYDMTSDKKLDFLSTKPCLNILQAAAKRTFSLLEIAVMLDVTQLDMSNFMKQNPKIQDAIDLGYSTRNTDVENALYKLATGYTVQEKTILINETGNREMKKTSISEKYIPPNERAARYWAENRRRFEYKSNTAELEVGSGNAFEIKVKFEGTDE